MRVKDFSDSERLGFKKQNRKLTNEWGRQTSIITNRKKKALKF